MPIQFQGGPLAGQGTMTDEEMDGMGPPQGMVPPGAGPAPEEAPPEQDEAAMFSSLLETIRGLLSLGSVSEQNKLNLEKASTLVQQIMAAEEKDGEAAMTGKLTPALMRKMGGQGGGY